MWSLVVTSFELACLRLPTNEFTFTEAEKERLSVEYRDLVGRVLKVDPKERMTVAEIVRHSWI